MKTYEEMVAEYKKRQHDTMVDTLAVGLTYVDELAVDTGILEETNLLTELTSSACTALPFVMIAATEGGKVVLGRKSSKSGVKDGAYRMVKSGVAMGVGGAVAAAAGFWAALPVTMGVRAMFDHYRSHALTGHRVQGRINRLKELQSFLNENTESLTVQEEH